MKSQWELPLFPAHDSPIASHTKVTANTQFGFAFHLHIAGCRHCRHSRSGHRRILFTAQWSTPHREHLLVISLTTLFSSIHIPATRIYLAVVPFRIGRIEPWLWSCWTTNSLQVARAGWIVIITRIPITRGNTCKHVLPNICCIGNHLSHNRSHMYVRR